MPPSDIPLRTTEGRGRTYDSVVDTIGNTPAMDRAFLGEVHLVAIYDRALGAGEVAQNRMAGADP